MRLDHLQNVKTRLPMQSLVFENRDGERFLTEVLGCYFSTTRGIVEYVYDVAKNKITHEEIISVEESAKWPLAEVSAGMADVFQKINCLGEREFEKFIDRQNVFTLTGLAEHL